MAPALPGIYKAIFIYLEPILTLGGAYASYTSPEWFLARLIPGDTNTGLIHTSETIMAIRLYAVLLFLLAGISISVFSAVGGKEDKLALSVTRRLLFVLAGISLLSLEGTLTLMVVADLGHVYVTAANIGWDTVKDVGQWNDMTWGNMGITLFLFVARVFWFLSVGTRGVSDDKKRQ